MSKDYGVTSGHPLYSMHRFRHDVRHMVIFDDLVESGFHRLRLYLTDEAYEVARKEEKKGHIKIIYHVPVIDGSFAQVIGKEKNNKSRRTAKKEKRRNEYECN